LSKNVKFIFRNFRIIGGNKGFILENKEAKKEIERE